MIVEKEKLWGGTSATSGAGIWIPASDQAAAAGFHDNVDDAFKYVRKLSGMRAPAPHNREAFDAAVDAVAAATEVLLRDLVVRGSRAST